MAEKMNAPTLIVGLGGRGADLTAKVCEMTEGENRNIGFIAFDTDVNELAAIKAKYPKIKTVQTSPKITVGEALANDENARKKWFPVNEILNAKTFTEGAGQVRAVSRLAFELCLREGKLEELHRAINELFQLEKEEKDQALRVIIVSSLAGGTGSGLILPISLYIKNYLKKHYHQSASIVRGFFILPEVFFPAVTGQAERNNLMSNAYASLKEIDAFLMKGNGYLPERYAKKTKIEFPRPESDEYEEYDLSPLDFAFLFDAKNVNDKELSSFEQYNNHAANCIYALSIGPMNKRTNSSEDNQIRQLARTLGRARYVGAGGSKVVYPWKDVRDFVANNWAKESITDQWLVYDKEFREREAEEKQARLSGQINKSLSRAEEYINAIENGKKRNDLFSTIIYNQCVAYDEEGLDELSKKWEDYIGGLSAYIEDTNSVGNVARLDESRASAKSKINSLDEGKDDPEEYNEAYKSLEAYKRKTKSVIGNKAKATAYSLFNTNKTVDVTKKNDEYRLEYYFQTNGKFIHPNAIRFFLYQVEILLVDELRETQNIIANKQEKYFDNFEKTTFNVASKDEGDVSADILLDKDKVKKIKKVNYQEFRDKFNAYLKKVDQYRVKAVYREVLDEAIKYVRKTIQSFEEFYDRFDDRVESIKKNLFRLESKYSDTKGEATIYVCASKICLAEFNKRMHFESETGIIDSDLSRKIYSEIREYSYLSTDSKPKDFFDKLFRDGILGFYKNEVERKYNDYIRMDIIDAIEREFEFEKNISDLGEKRHYVLKTLNNAKGLAAPFIEKPIGETRDPVLACAYNPNLSLEDNLDRENLINRELQEYGGCPSEEIGTNMIVFFNAIYGLMARDISKFAPREYSDTNRRPAGNYNTAYFDLVSKIKPELNYNARELTPHLDKEWHTMTYLPDIDDEYQKLMEEKVYSALLWGFLLDLITYEKIGSEDGAGILAKYDYELKTKDSTNKILRVSNGTACDKFYEVLDALMLSAPATNFILAEKERAVSMEHADERATQTDNILVNKFKSLRFSEFDGSGAFKIENWTIFDIAMLLKISTPANEFVNEFGFDFLSTAFKEIEKYFALVAPDKEKNIYIDKFIRGQYDNFVKNMERNKGVYGNAERYASDLTGLILSSYLQEKGFIKLRDLSEFESAGK